MTLTRDGVRVRLQDLPFRLLLMLVERPADLITREEVRRGLWPENTFVEFDNNLGVAVRKVREALNDDPESPHYLATIPRRGYRFVAPVRVEASEAVEPITVSSVEPDPGQSSPTRISPAQSNPVKPIADYSEKSRWGRLVWIGIAGVGLVLVGMTLHRYGVRRPEKVSPLTAEANQVNMRRSVAVLGFRNLDGRPEDLWLSTVFTAMLNTELGSSSDLRMVSGEDVTRVKREMPLGDEDSLAKGTLNRLKSKAGADIVVLGSYMLIDRDGQKQLRLDLRLQDTTGGETIAEDAVSGTENDLFELAAKAGARLRESLGVKPRPESGLTLRAVLPANQAAMRLYAEGRAKLWAFDMLGARELLTKAVASDPGFSLARSALSEDLWHLGYQVRARAEAKRAFELSASLPKEDRLLIEGQYGRATGDWGRAVKAYQALFTMFPDSLDYGLLLSSAQLNVSPTDSLQTLAKLHQLPKPQGEDARIDMAEASAWIGRDMTKARNSADKAIVKATAEGSLAQIGWTHGVLCEQGTGIGEKLQEALNECERARQSRLAEGDLNGAAMMLTNQAAIYFQEGNVSQSETMFRAAIAEFRKVGNLDGEATARSNLAATLLQAGQFEPARKLWQEASSDYQALQDEDGIALNLNNLGDLERQSGNLEVAQARYAQAREVAERSDDKNALAYVLSGMGDVQTDRGNLILARKAYEQSFAIRNQIGQKGMAAEVGVSLAALSTEEGHAAESEALLRKWEDQFQKQQEFDDELTAATYLIQALLVEGKQTEAEKQVMGARALAARSQSLLLQLQFRLAAARTVQSSKAPLDAKSLLIKILEDTRRHGYFGLQLEVRLALLELEWRMGDRAHVLAQIAELDSDARNKGYEGIAHKALALKNGTTRGE